MQSILRRSICQVPEDLRWAGGAERAPGVFPGDWPGMRRHSFSCSGRVPRRVLITLLFALLAGAAAAQDRPTVGVALGGGSARGIAHVGVLRWFEEHHVPIDVAAGTSMGGLIGGSFATG